MKSLIKKWWFWAILIAIAISIVGVKIVELKTKETSEASSKNTNTRNIAILTYPELRYFLEEQGYTFETRTIESLNWTYFYNKNISVSAIIEIDSYKYIIEYCDKSLEGYACCITDTSANTSEEKKQQYNSYLKWKDSIGLTEEQIKEVLLKYYLDNK